jgi:hypothetical protein
VYLGLTFYSTHLVTEGKGETEGEAEEKKEEK